MEMALTLVWYSAVCEQHDFTARYALPLKVCLSSCATAGGAVGVMFKGAAPGQCLQGTKCVMKFDLDDAVRLAVLLSSRGTNIEPFQTY